MISRTERFLIARKTNNLFCPPERNTIEQSAGKFYSLAMIALRIQHMRPRQHSSREHNRKYNSVVVYLEAASQAWPAYAAAHPDSPTVPSLTSGSAGN